MANVTRTKVKPQNIAPRSQECAHGVETFRSGGYPTSRSKEALAKPQASGRPSGSKRG